MHTTKWAPALLLASIFGVPIASAAPTVVGYELVSSTRSGRTAFDYTYRIRVANGSPAFSDVVMTVTTTAPGTTVLQPVVHLGDLAENSQTTSRETFSIRQDRQVPFAPAAFRWQVDGDAVELPTGPLTIVSAAFVELKGRPDHQGLESITGNPFAHAAGLVPVLLTLNLPLTNGVVSLLDVDGQLLSSSPLSAHRPASVYTPKYVASVQVPTRPFRLRLTGGDRTGSPVQLDWPELFLPTSADIRFVTEFALVAPGSTTSMTLRLSNGPQAQPFTLSLQSTIAAATLSPSTQTIELGAGETREIPISITLPTGATLPDGGLLLARLVGQRDAAARNSATATLETVPNLP